MKKVEKIEKDAKTEIIKYIINEYDKNYRKQFKKSEFTDQLALEEIILELKELKYVKCTRKEFSISLLGIRHIREILFSREQYLGNLKGQWFGIIISYSLALVSNLIAIYSFDSFKTRAFLVIMELILIFIIFKNIDKIDKEVQ